VPTAADERRLPVIVVVTAAAAAVVVVVESPGDLLAYRFLICKFFKYAVQWRSLVGPLSGCMLQRLTVRHIPAQHSQELF